MNVNMKRTGRGLRARHILGTLVVLALAGAIALVVANRDSADTADAVVTIEQFADLGGDIVVIGGGRTSLTNLAATLAAQGTSGAVTDSGSAIRVGKSIVVKAGGRLDVTGGTVELASGDTPVSIEARGGQVRIAQSTVRGVDPTSGEPDADGSNGRAWLAVRDGGRLVISGATLEALGDLTAHPAIEIAGTSTSAVIRNTTLAGGSGIVVRGGTDTQMMSVTIDAPKIAGISLESARNARLDKITVRNSATNGIAIAGGSKDIRITQADVQSSTGHGLAIGAASSDITVTSSLFQMNQGAGVGIDSAYGVHFSDTRSIGNDIGIDLTASSNDVTITKSRLASNRLAGLRLASPGAVASVSNSRIEHNDSGVFVSDGNAIVGPGNRISSNGTGIKSLDTTPGMTVLRNRIFDNFGDGMFLVAPEGLDVRNNKLENNEFASFGVLAAGQTTEWRKTNDVKPGTRFGWERVPQAFETRILTGAGPEVPLRSVPEVVTYFSPLPKTPVGIGGTTTPNPLTTPNNLPPEVLAEAIRQAEKAIAEAAARAAVKQ